MIFYLKIINKFKNSQYTWKQLYRKVVVLDWGSFYHTPNN